MAFEILPLDQAGMTKPLHIALLVLSAYGVASACEDGTLDVVRGTRCRRYAVCQNGSWHLKECKNGHIFDPNITGCAPVMEVGSCKDVSKCGEGRAYSHLGSSNLYYRCINGRISVQVCGTGEIFDPDLQECRFHHSFYHPGLARAKRDAGEGCVEGSKQRVGKSCKDYIECIKKLEVKKSCPDCMNFDDKTQSCRFVVLAPCGKIPTPAPTSQPTEAPTTSQPTEAPTTPQTTEAPTTPQPTEAPTTPQPTEAPTTPQPTEAPTTPQPTEAPTTPQPTEAPTTPQPTEAPTTPQPTEAPTTPQPTEAPTTPQHTEAPTTPQPTEAPTTPQPTEASTTPEPTDPPTTAEPTTVSPCKEGEKIGLVDPECKAYKVCKKGVWVNDACGWSRKFDAIKKQCEYTWFGKVTCAT